MLFIAGSLLKGLLLDVKKLTEIHYFYFHTVCIICALLLITYYIILLYLPTFSENFFVGLPGFPKATRPNPKKTRSIPKLSEDVPQFSEISMDLRPLEF